MKRIACSALLLLIAFLVYGCFIFLEIQKVKRVTIGEIKNLSDSTYVFEAELPYKVGGPWRLDLSGTSPEIYEIWRTTVEVLVSNQGKEDVFFAGAGTRGSAVIHPGGKGFTIKESVSEIREWRMYLREPKGVMHLRLTVKISSPVKLSEPLRFSAFEDIPSL